MTGFVWRQEDSDIILKVSAFLTQKEVLNFNKAFVTEQSNYS